MTQPIIDLGRQATTVDGVSPFNEATLMALSDGSEPRILVEHAHGIALGFDDNPVELVVAPHARRQGVGTTVLRQALDRGETRFWAHGDLPSAQALASGHGLEPVRTLLVLRLDSPTSAPATTRPGLMIEPFTEADVDAIIDINARAFADHPEQGGMDRADFDRRRRESWFDPAGLFVARRNSEVVGFHWTKVEGTIGEVYVVGVDPDAHGGGVGTALTDHGLRHLWAEGVKAIDLYVEGDNDPALAVYRGLGFSEHARDTLYELR